MHKKIFNKPKAVLTDILLDSQLMKTKCIIKCIFQTVEICNYYTLDLNVLILQVNNMKTLMKIVQ